MPWFPKATVAFIRLIAADRSLITSWSRHDGVEEIDKNDLLCRRLKMRNSTVVHVSTGAAIGAICSHILRRSEARLHAKHQWHCRLVCSSKWHTSKLEMWRRTYSTLESRRILGANANVLNRSEQNIVLALSGIGQGYLFKNWPAPGKIQLLSSFKGGPVSLQCIQCLTSSFLGMTNNAIYCQQDKTSYGSLSFLPTGINDEGKRKLVLLAASSSSESAEAARLGKALDYKCFIPWNDNKAASWDRHGHRAWQKGQVFWCFCILA